MSRKESEGRTYSDASPARARVIEEIKDLMTAGQWRASKSHKELAEKHGVAVRYVKDLATQAGHELHALMVGKTEEERDAARARILARMEDLREKALAHVRVYVDREGEAVEYPAPEFRTALEIDKAELQTLGLNAPTRTQEVAPEPLPDDELEAKLEEALAAVKERRAAKQLNGGAKGDVH